MIQYEPNLGLTSQVPILDEVEGRVRGDGTFHDFMEHLFLVQRWEGHVAVIDVVDVGVEIWD